MKNLFGLLIATIVVLSMAADDAFAGRAGGQGGEDPLRLRLMERDCDPLCPQDCPRDCPQDCPRDCNPDCDGDRDRDRDRDGSCGPESDFEPWLWGWGGGW